MPDAAEFVDKVLDIAARLVGVRETAANRGDMVDKFHLYAGRDPAAADSWCAQFVFWCFGHAAEEMGLAIPLPKASSVWGLWQRAPLSFRVADPQPGDIFLVDHGSGKGHCGIVTGRGFGEGVLTTVEGNTSVSGSRNGDGVYNRTRGMKEITLGFLRPTVIFDEPAVVA